MIDSSTFSLQRGALALVLVLGLAACRGTAGPAGPVTIDSGTKAIAGQGGQGGQGGQAGQGATAGTGGAAPQDAAAPGTIDEPDPSPPDGGAPSPAADGGAPVPAAAPRVPTPSAACNAGKAAPMQGYHDLMVGASRRRFIIRLPGSYDGKKAWPVIFAFHGAGGQDATTFDTKFGFRAANGERAVLVFGEALPRPQGGRSWMIDTAANMAYIDALVAWLDANVCFDRSKLFATGQSSGGYFSQTLGCQRGHVFRAVAPSSGGWRDFDNCMGNPGVWMSHGKTDTGTAADVARAKQFWLDRKMCSPDNPKPTDPAPCVSYSGCKDDVPFVFCEHGGGHPWPAYATGGVWTFFSQFQ
jgi:polyhydroxybutyrate depolymerase